MARIPITLMGFRCERCRHEWIPRGNAEMEPRVCPNPACKSPYWNRPRKSATTYEEFCKAIEKSLRKAKAPLTWTEVRTVAGLPQTFPNNKWVRKMEADIGLSRRRDEHGIIHWQLRTDADLLADDESTAETAIPKGARATRK
jgi:hypothetical protein